MARACWKQVSARACWSAACANTNLALHTMHLGLGEALLGAIHDGVGLVQEAESGVRLTRLPIGFGQEGQKIGQPQRGLRGAVDGQPLVHRGNLLGGPGPGRTRPALEDQAYPERIGHALLAANARGGFRMPARLLPVPPVLMEHRQHGETHRRA